MTQPSVHQLYQRLETVGKGSYGSVHKGIHRPTGNVVALKIIDLDADDGDDVDSIQSEVALLTQLRDGPNITKYYGCYLDGPRVWIVMEFAQGGSVYSLMQSSPDNCLEEKYVVVIVREVLVGLNYLHKSNVIHRDIKAANVLVTASGKVMICDFGVSALLATTSSKRNTFIGTPYWMAPEVAQPVPAYDTKADIWSLGIMIYEMIKGSPPHFRIAHLKVIQMIPKVKPPRLIDGEGSKDLRDFIPFCLTESPSDRLTAEELLKTKWIKNATKSPFTILKDLLSRYDGWIKKGSKPSDLSEPLPWEKDEDDGNTDPDENPWEFDTVRGRSFDATASLRATTVDGEENFATVRPQPSQLPKSLRGIFDGDAASAPDPFRIPGFGATGKSGAVGIPVSPLPPPSPAVPLPAPRDRAARRALRVENSFEDGPNLSNATFAFPPRTTSRGAKTNLAGSSPPEENVLPASSRHSDADTFNIARSSSPSGSMVSGSSTPTPLFVTPKLSAPRDIRLDQGSPSPEYPPQGPSQDTNFLSTNKSDTLLTDLGQAPAISRRGPAFRNRSQGSAQGLSTRSGLERGNVSASDFQFPEYPPPDSDPSMSSHSGLRAHSRTSPTRASTSSSSISLHNTTHSLDARIQTGSPRRPSPPRAVPPVLGRSRSATPADEPPHELYVGPPTGGPKSQRRPSLHRLASLAVMETTPIAPPVKPFAKASRDRSGGSAGGIGDLSSLPGLKDVLKVPTLEHQLGMTDLLPPSPTTLTTNLKPFTAAPSHLNFSFVPLDGTHPQSANASLAPSTSFGRANGISHLIPSPDLHPGLPSSASSSLFPAVHRRNGSFPSTSPTSLPPVRKLDFAALMASHEDTHAELGRIVDDLMQWLSITELGLTQLLERSSEDRIEEEAEDPDHGPSYEGTTGTDDESDALALAAR